MNLVLPLGLKRLIICHIISTIPFPPGLCHRGTRPLGAGVARPGGHLRLPDLLDGGGARGHPRGPRRPAGVLRQAGVPAAGDRGPGQRQAVQADQDHPGGLDCHRRARQGCGGRHGKPRYDSAHHSKLFNHSFMAQKFVFWGQNNFDCVKIQIGNIFWFFFFCVWLCENDNSRMIFKRIECNHFKMFNFLKIYAFSSICLLC